MGTKKRKREINRPTIFIYNTGTDDFSQRTRNNNIIFL